MVESKVEEMLRALLVDILAQTESSPVQSPDDLAAGRPLSDLGVCSVDLMEFVLRAEQQFDVDLLSNLSPESLPSTIEEWSALVCDQQRVG